MKKFSTKALVICSLLSALSIVCGKFLAIPVGDTMRFSFESTPLFLAGFMFGPVIGGIVAFVADILGSILRGYDINPLITLGAVFIGVSGGLSYKLFENMPLFFRIFFSVLLAHVIGSVLIKSLGLYLFYHTPFTVLILGRSINYLIMIFIDTVVLYFLYKSRSFKKLLESLK